jgi:pilus assembly protein TadC
LKLLASLCAAACAGCLVRGAFYLTENASRPDPDFVTQALRKTMEKLLARNSPLLSRYVSHLHPILSEVPLSPALDLPLFLALHALAGFPIWIVISYAFPGATLWMLPFCFGIAMPLPYVWLKHKQAQFHTVLLKSLPECLELQALVMEAGLDLNAGIQHYLDKGTPNPLQLLLKGVQKEIQLGRSRLDAFSSLAQKTTFQPLREVCRGIVQALSLGTNLAPLLREQAIALRIKRMQFAEKKAAEAPLKVLFPLFVFIFPTIFIVLLGPMAMMFMQGGF